MRHALSSDLRTIVDFNCGLAVCDAPLFFVDRKAVHEPFVAISELNAIADWGQPWRFKFTGGYAYSIEIGSHRMEAIERGGKWRLYRNGSPLMSGEQIATFKTSEDARLYGQTYANAEAELKHRPSTFEYLGHYHWREPASDLPPTLDERSWIARFSETGAMLEFDVNFDKSPADVAIIENRAAFAFWRYEVGRLVTRLALWPDHDEAKALYVLHKQGEAHGWDFAENVKRAGAAVLSWVELDEDFRVLRPGETLPRRSLTFCGPMNRYETLRAPSERLLQQVLAGLDFYADVNALATV